MPYGQNKSRRVGFTLTEMAIVLGVAGIITSAIWYASSNTRETQKENDAVVEVQTVVQNMNALYQGHNIPGAAGGNVDITAAMIGVQVIPSLYINASNAATANNPWAPQNFFVYKTGPRQFHISLANVTRRGCMQVLMQGTTCHFGQAGCPTQVATACSGGACLGGPLVASVALDWSVAMSMNAASALCAVNIYPGWRTVDTVDLYYTL